MLQSDCRNGESWASKNDEGLKKWRDHSIFRDGIEREDEASGLPREWREKLIKE
jgi:hypothetical protein